MLKIFQPLLLLLLGEGNLIGRIWPFWRSQSASRILFFFTNLKGLDYIPCSCKCVNHGAKTPPSMMENKIRKHEVKMPPSMMSNPLVNVANLGAIIEGSVSLMLNDFFGVLYLACVKKNVENRNSRIGILKWPKTSYRIPFPRECLRKVCFPWFNVFPLFRQKR